MITTNKNNIFIIILRPTTSRYWNIPRIIYDCISLYYTVQLQMKNSLPIFFRGGRKCTGRNTFQQIYDGSVEVYWMKFKSSNVLKQNSPPKYCWRFNNWRFNKLFYYQDVLSYEVISTSSSASVWRQRVVYYSCHVTSPRGIQYWRGIHIYLAFCLSCNTLRNTNK